MSRSDGHEYEKTVYELVRGMDQSRNKNWLGHRLNTTASKIDEMILDGATIEEIAKKCRATKQNVSDHLAHLRTEHGIPLKNESGKIMIDHKEVTKKIDGMIPRSMKPLFKG